MVAMRIVHCAPLLIVLCIFSSNFVSGQDGFFFTMPKVLREKDTSKFCFTTYTSDGDNRNLTLSLVNRNDPFITFFVDDIYANGVEKCNNFTVPKADDYMLLIYNGTHILHDSVEVTVKPHSLITLIQTDKPIYKPGQKVKFRILTIQSNQKPRRGTIAAVYVKDPNGSRVKQFLNIDSRGIASLEFQLSKEAKLGRWQIAVFLNETDINGHDDGMVSFEVKEYVLPRFEVTITPPSYILASDEILKGNVCAKYTYGKDVNGFLELKICGSEQYGFGRNDIGCDHRVVQMTGCYEFSANTSEIMNWDYHSFYGWSLKIDASVTEAGTGSVVNATHKGLKLTKQPLKLELKDTTNGFFKPGLPFHGKVVVKKPDGEPAKGETIKVTAYDFDSNIRFSSNYTSDKTGTVEYALCGNLAEDVISLSITAEAVEYENLPEGMYSPRTVGEIKQWFSPSFSYIQIPRTEGKQKCGDKLNLSIPFTTKDEIETEFKYQVIARGKVVVSGRVRHKASRENVDQSTQDNCLMPDPLTPVPTPPTNPFIPPFGYPSPPPFIEEGDSTDDLPLLKDGDDDEVFLVPPPLPPIDPFGPSEPPFKEPIIRSEFIADSVSSFTLEIPITTIMAPKFTLIVHHVLPDREVVADSMEFLVEPCFDNDVKMTFNKSTVLPGEKVNVRLEAEPGSVCGLGIVDKSVNILGGDHQITIDTIYDKIESLSINRWSTYSYESEREYCERRVKKFINDELFWDISSRYVDATEAFKSSGLIVLTDLNLETRPCQVSSHYAYDFSRNYLTSLPEGNMRVMPMPAPNMPMPVAVPLSTKNRPSLKADSVRSHFPETWLWDLKVVGDDGSLDLPQVAPHTVTSWVGNAMCMDSDKGVGISPMQSLTTFQPFFIHLNLPFSTVRGERVPIMFTVHNYLNKCLHMVLALDMGAAFKVHNNFHNRQPFCVCQDKAFTTKFYATPLDIGSFPIIAKAEIIPGLCNGSVNVDLTYIGLSDAVKRQVLVKAEGVTKDYTHTLYMCSNGNETAFEDVILPLPSDIVKDSESGFVKVIGDIMGPALTNLDNLVRMPTGCGEQNMVGFTPNIFVLKYLKSSGILTEEIYNNAIKFMEIGYQRELNYRHKDGSYSAFGEDDKKGSVWLTAFVVKSFAQATPYIWIDPMDIERSVKFLKRSQYENGCFVETGKVFSSYMMGGLGKKKSAATLTSYVLVALLQAGVNSSETVIVEGFKCIENEMKLTKGKMDVYSLALTAYATTLHDPFSKSSIEIMKILENKAKRDGSLKFWNRDGVQSPRSNSMFYHNAASAEVEMTSYALLAYLIYYGEGAIQHSHEIAMWLSHQRNPHGGFASTQDTVVGLNALSEFAIMAYNENPTNLNISVSGNGIEKTFHVSEKEKTKLLVQTTPITIVPVRVMITAQGEGCALVQANVRFNKLPQNIGSNKPGFHLKIMPRRYRHDEDRCDKRTLNIAVGMRSRGYQKHSKGMSLVMVKMVTSWTPIKDSLVKLQSQFPVIGIKRYEYDEVENVITFYFEEFRRRPREFTLDVEQDRELAVSNPKAAQVSVINYYETDVAVVKSYSLKTICGTKEEIPRKRIIPFDPRRPIPVQVRIDMNRRIPPMAPRPAPSNSNSTASKKYECPICWKTKNMPANFKDDICNSTSVYKTISGRKGTYTLKIKQDLRPQKKITLNKFANFTMPKNCECSLLTPPVNRIFIITSLPLKRKMLKLDSKTIIAHSTRKMERALFKLKKTCPRGA